MPLSTREIESLKPDVRPYKRGDSGGLYLLVMPNGGLWWRLKYRIGGVEKRLSLGVYPAVSLATARTARDDARRLVASGVDPSANRKAAKEAGARAAVAA